MLWLRCWLLGLLFRHRFRLFLLLLLWSVSFIVLDLFEDGGQDVPETHPVFNVEGFDGTANSWFLVLLLLLLFMLLFWLFFFSLLGSLDVLFGLLIVIRITKVQKL